MMLVPIGTDAPIYHFPWATIGIMIVNTLTIQVLKKVPTNLLDRKQIKAFNSIAQESKKRRGDSLEAEVADW